MLDATHDRLQQLNKQISWLIICMIKLPSKNHVGLQKWQRQAHKNLKIVNFYFKNRFQCLQNFECSKFDANANWFRCFKSPKVHNNHRSQKVTNNNLTTLSWRLLCSMREIMIRLSRSWQPSQQNGNQNTWWSRWDLKALKKEKGLHNWAHDHGHTCMQQQAGWRRWSCNNKCCNSWTKISQNF